MTMSVNACRVAAFHPKDFMNWADMAETRNYVHCAVAVLLSLVVTTPSVARSMQRRVVK